MGTRSYQWVAMHVIGVHGLRSDAPSPLQGGSTSERGGMYRPLQFADAHYGFDNFSVSHVAQGHEGCVNSFAWDDSGQWMVSGSDDCFLTMYRLTQALNPVCHWTSGHRGNILSVCFAGKWLTVASGAADGRVRVHRPPSGHGGSVGLHTTHAWQITGEVTDIVFDNYQHHSFLAGTTAGKLYRHDLRQRTPIPLLQLIDDDQHAGIASLAMHPLIPDTIAIAAASPDVPIFDLRFSAKPVANCSPGFALARDIPAHAVAVSWDQSGQQLAVSYNQDCACVYDVSSFLIKTAGRLEQRTVQAAQAAQAAPDTASAAQAATDSASTAPISAVSTVPTNAQQESRRRATGVRKAVGRAVEAAAAVPVTPVENEAPLDGPRSDASHAIAMQPVRWDEVHPILNKPLSEWGASWRSLRRLEWREGVHIAACSGSVGSPLRPDPPQSAISPTDTASLKSVSGKTLDVKDVYQYENLGQARYSAWSGLGLRCPVTVQLQPATPRQWNDDDSEDVPVDSAWRPSVQTGEGEGTVEDAAFFLFTGPLQSFEPMRVLNGSTSNRTRKARGVAFVGDLDDLLAECGDCGRIFIWRIDTQQLVRVMTVDSISNCVVPRYGRRTPSLLQRSMHPLELQRVLRGLAAAPPLYRQRLLLGLREKHAHHGGLVHGRRRTVRAPILPQQIAEQLKYRDRSLEMAVSGIERTIKVISRCAEALSPRNEPARTDALARLPEDSNLRAIYRAAVSRQRVAVAALACGVEGLQNVFDAAPDPTTRQAVAWNPSDRFTPPRMLFVRPLLSKGNIYSEDPPSPTEGRAAEATAPASSISRVQAALRRLSHHVHLSGSVAVDADRETALDQMRCLSGPADSSARVRPIGTSLCALWVDPIADLRTWVFRGGRVTIVGHPAPGPGNTLTAAWVYVSLWDAFRDPLLAVDDPATILACTKAWAPHILFEKPPINQNEASTQRSMLLQMRRSRPPPPPLLSNIRLHCRRCIVRNQDIFDIVGNEISIQDGVPVHDHTQVIAHGSLRMQLEILRWVSVSSPQQVMDITVQAGVRQQLRQLMAARGVTSLTEAFATLQAASAGRPPE